MLILDRSAYARRRWFSIWAKKQRQQTVERKHSAALAVYGRAVKIDGPPGSAAE
jgi:hypothetical protein